MCPESLQSSAAQTWHAQNLYSSSVGYNGEDNDDCLPILLPLRIDRF